MSFPYNDDERMWKDHADKLRERAYEYDEMALRSWQKRLGQHARKLERIEKEESEKACATCENDFTYSICKYCGGDDNKKYEEWQPKL